MKPIDIECVLEAGAVLAEGPVWDPVRGGLWWVDIERGTVHFRRGEAGDQRWQLGGRTGFVIPTERGDVIVGVDRGIVRLDPGNGAVTPVIAVESHLPGNRFNDAKCDPAGRLWAGTMSVSEAPGLGGLYRLGSDWVPRRMVGDVSISNGLAWALDGRTMYYVDSPTRRIDAFDFDPMTGEVSNRREVVRIPAGYPDGMCIDAEGHLWVALWGGWGVGCFDPRSGRQIARIELPVEAVTSCCFGGPGCDALYITTAGRDLDAAGKERQPLAGAIFRARVGTTGTPTRRFVG